MCLGVKGWIRIWEREGGIIVIFNYLYIMCGRYSECNPVDQRSNPQTSTITRNSKKIQH